MKRHIIPVVLGAMIAVAGCSDDADPTPETVTTEAQSTVSDDPAGDASVEPTEDPVTESVSPSPAPTSESNLVGEFSDADIPQESGKGASSPQAAVKQFIYGLENKDPQLLCDVIEDGLLESNTGERKECVSEISEDLDKAPSLGPIEEFVYLVYTDGTETAVEVKNPAETNPLVLAVIEKDGGWYVRSAQDS